MKTRKVLSTITAAVLAFGFVLLIAENSNAQGRYANRYSRQDVSGIIARMETSSDEFQRDFARSMNNSNLNGTQQEERFNNIVRDFENAVDRLRRQFDRNNSWWESRNDVQNMIRDARPVNTMMTTLSFRRNIERQWNALRNNINTVADTYDLPGLNGGGWTGGGGNQTSTPPNWAQGTFYSVYPSVRMTISRNGEVTSNISGQTFSGRYYRGSIHADGQTATVTRTQNGIRTYNTVTGQTIDFSRGQGGGDGGGEDGPTSTPPNWARGTFYSDYPEAQITISRNGRVTSVVNGQTYYGRYYAGAIYSSDGQIATVTRAGNGFRTYNRTDGQTFTFRRR